MDSAVLYRLIFEIIRLVAMISFGVLVATIIELIKIDRWLSFLIKPLVRLTALSEVGATAFITAFVSPRAANIMLAHSCDEGVISKKEMILSALSNSTAALITHLRITAFILIPLLGVVGIWYILVQAIGAIITTISSLLLLKKIKKNSAINIIDFRKKIDNENNSFWEIFISRNSKILLRVLFITVPLYIVIYFLNYYTFFSYLSRFIPDRLQAILPPESLLIIGVHFSGIIPAASAASLALNGGLLSSYQVIITLLAGYIITTPIRAVRHTLPSALGIFPGKTGVYIIAASQAVKIMVAIVAIIITVRFF